MATHRHERLSEVGCDTWPVKAAPSPVQRALADNFLKAVEGELARLFADERAAAANAAPTSTLLLDEVGRIVEAGGKRLRPLFCYWGYRAGGGRNEDAIPRAGAAIELLHTCALIHDDLIDASDSRRGVPSTFRKLQESLGGGIEKGRAAAVLAGDLAQALADRLLMSSAFPAERILPAFDRFNDMRVQAVGGEFLELLGAADEGLDERAARRIAAQKSGSYSVAGPLLVGAALAGADASVEATLGDYGWALGEAFQLRDDILSTFGDPALTGKDADSDIRQGTPTALVVNAREAGGAPVRRMLKDLLGKDGLSSEDVERVRAVIVATGAVSHVVGLVNGLVERAKSALEGGPIGEESAVALADLAESMAMRGTA